MIAFFPVTQVYHISDSYYETTSIASYFLFQ